MKQKTQILTILFFLGLNISCEKWFCTDSCCGESIDPSYFNVQGMNAAIFSSRFERHKEGDTLKSTDLQIYFDFQMVYFSFQRPNPSSFLTFGNSAYACSPAPPGSAGSKTERFEKISIITLFDYNQDYKANDTISEIVDLSLGGPQNPSPYYYGNNLDLAAMGPYPFLKMAEFGDMEFIKTFQYKLHIKFTNGEEYEAFSPKVFLSHP
tara:strand:- start:1937 stop:2563 length:627 start_codon:yes stop_codon:yes gene_type:complete